ncbi:SanA/YdcF family protein, partial [Bacteroides acidifaciens]|uniref:SanA/YdcF family protein n=1 Tax=Bacteroides acidifaciens TaxID=85831 RepID=UPI00261D34E4
MKRTKWIKRTIICIVAIVGVLAIIMAVCDRMVDHAAKNKLYETVEDVPHRKVGLVLGTSPISTWNGRRNYYFDHRIKAAADLYNAGKVEWLVVSGGDYRNTENGYDEPVAMRDSLMKQGVDSVRIILDYDGTRTLNSIAKMRDVYRQDSIIIISQKYHNERALYQAKHLGIDAIGYNAKTPGRRTSWWRNRGREVLARVKLFIDIARGMQPDIKESMVSDFTESKLDFLSESHIQTEYGDLICLKPD